MGLYTFHEVDISKYPHVLSEEYENLDVNTKMFLDACIEIIEECTSCLTIFEFDNTCIVYTEFIHDNKVKIAELKCTVKHEQGIIEWICEDLKLKGIINNYIGCPYDLTGKNEDEIAEYYESFGDDFDDLFELDDIDDDDLYDFDEDFDSDISEDVDDESKELFNAIKTELERKMGISFDDHPHLLESLNKEFEEKSKDLKFTNTDFPEPKPHWKTPQEQHALATCDWESSRSPIFLNPKLSMEDVSGSIYFSVAHCLLTYTNEKSVLKLTQTGNLKRADILNLLDMDCWPEGYVEEIRRMYKAINEDNVYLLHTVRALLEVCGILDYDGNRLSVEKTHVNLLKDENAGALYRKLFSTYFKGFNIYFSYPYIPEIPSLPFFVPYYIAQIRQLKDKFYSVGEIVAECDLRIVSQELETMDAAYTHYNGPNLIFEHVILDALYHLGALERREKVKYTHEYRITELAKRFIVVS